MIAGVGDGKDDAETAAEAVGDDAFDELGTVKGKHGVYGAILTKLS